MANYFIIGGDEKVYGPISEADVRQWITEGRLNGVSRAKAESDAEFRPLAQFPEFAGALGLQVPSAAFSTTESSTDFQERDYELDIGGCISSGYTLLKENFVTVFFSFLILVAIQIACGGVLGMIAVPFGKSMLHWPTALRLGYDFVTKLALSLVVGPMAGGLFLVYLKTIRKQATNVGEVFAGFQQAYMPLFLGSLMVSLVINLCMLPFQFVWQVKAGPLLEQMQHMQNNPAGMQNLLPQFMLAFTNSLPVLFVCLVPVTFFTVCWQFTLPLIIDKRMDFVTAMKTSWKMVMKHWWHVFGLTVVVGLVSMAGVLGCCIGVVFTAPIGMAAMMFAYETIFGAKKN